MAINNNTTKINELIDAINALPEVKDTSDATATANDIVEGVTAYVNGEKIIGSIPIDANPVKETLYYGINNGLLSSYWLNTERVIIEPNAAVGTYIDSSEFGDATVADVVEGKTFTSQNGLKLTGTYVAPTGGGLPSGVSKLACGTITPSDDVTYLNITHDLGVTPNFLIWFVENDLGTTGVASIATDGSLTIKNVKLNTTSTTIYNVHYVCHGYNASTAFGQTAGKYSNSTDMTTTIARMRSVSPYYIKAGYKYYWICGVLDNVL